MAFIIRCNWYLGTRLDRDQYYAGYLDAEDASSKKYPQHRWSDQKDEAFEFDTEYDAYIHAGRFWPIKSEDFFYINTETGDETDGRGNPKVHAEETSEGRGDSPSEY